MDLEEFRKEFIEASKALAEVDGDFEESAFVTEAARRLVEAEEISDFEPCHFEGTGTRQRKLAMDGYWIDEVDGTVSLVVVHYAGGDSVEQISSAEISKCFGSAGAFVEEALAGRLTHSLEESTPAYGFASELYNNREVVTRFRTFLVTDCVLSSRVKDWPEGKLADLPVEYHIWDVARFLRVFESATGRDELVVDFTEFSELGLPCLEAGQKNSDYASYLCVIPADVLVNVYERFGSRLLEGNVRAFLSTRPKVNKNMRLSILKEPRMFFAYNNGIAATATDVEIFPGKHGLRVTGATYLQIVNGGQTTASLALARRKDKADLSDIYVPMKLSVISPEDAHVVIPRISYCANSQNKVSDVDFFSNHPFHVRIEEHSRRIWAPATGGAQHETHWFYERARGQYLNEQIKLKGNAKTMFLYQNPRDQVITKTDLAKFENAWRGLPHIVSRGSQKNFLDYAEYIADQWTQSEPKFNEEYFRRIVGKAILFRKIESIVTRQPWYQNGYRANIVAYSVALLAHLVQKQVSRMAMDFKSVWTKQNISHALENQLVLIAKAVFDEIVAPDSQFQNITEWCKKEACWNRIKGIELRLSASFTRELISADEAKSDNRSASNEQEIVSGIEMQTKVVELGGEFWAQVKTWGTERELLSEKDTSLLAVAAKIPTAIPSEKQCSALLKMLRLLEEEGFDFSPRIG